MGRWTSDEHGCIYDEAGCFARLKPNKADRLATRHNADIDALTAERDELQRRLEEIVKHAATPNWGDIVCAGGKLELATTRLDEILAIAEGRTE